jgi:hypothetical protein
VIGSAGGVVGHLRGHRHDGQAGEAGEGGESPHVVVRQGWHALQVTGRQGAQPTQQRLAMGSNAGCGAAALLCTLGLQLLQLGPPTHKDGACAIQEAMSIQRGGEMGEAAYEQAGLSPASISRHSNIARTFSVRQAPFHGWKSAGNAAC